MIPTMYLRQIEINTYCNGEYLMLENKPTNKTEVTGYRLQQWCYTNDETGGPPVYLDATKQQELMRGEEVEGGAWRDVPIVEDV